MQEKIVVIRGNSFRCNCGCGITYDQQGFVDHYWVDILPNSLAQYADRAKSDKCDDIVRDVIDPKNHRIL